MSVVVKEFKSTKEKVRDILHRYPSARNNLPMTYLLYLKHHSKLGKYIPFIPPKEVNEVIPNPDTIARARRFIQRTEKDPKAQPSPKVRQLRNEAEEDCREFFGKNNRS